MWWTTTASACCWGEYTLPRDLELPELAVADVIIHLEVERLAMEDLRTLRIYKSRGQAYVEGRHAYVVNDDGIQFIGDYREQLVHAEEPA